HELSGLAPLWQHLHVEPGWEAAFEAILRERMAALQIRQLEHARAFVNDPPPARLSFFQLPAAHPSSPTVPGLTPLAGMLRISDADLRTLLNDWLAGVYVAEDIGTALA